MREFLHLPGFVEQMVGMPTFSAKTFHLPLPEDYPIETLAGKTATYYVEARRVFQAPIPYLEDVAALQKAGLGNSVEEAMEILAREIDEEQGEELLMDSTQAVLRALAERIAENVPPAAIDEELRRTWERSEGVVLEGKGFSVPMVQSALAEFLANPQHRAEAEFRIKVGLALGAVVAKEGLSPTKECLDMLLEAAALGAGISAEEAKESLKQEHDGPQQAARMSLYFKAVEFIMSKAKVVVIDPSDGASNDIKSFDHS
jgi:trigger factor